MKKWSLLFINLVICLGLSTFVYAKIPNDPNAEQWAYKDIGVFEAWNHTAGSSDVIVAVIDNGIDMLHPDLEDNMWKNLKEVPDNGIDDDKNGYIDDVWGWNFADNNNNPRPNVANLTNSEKIENIPSHGTMVAGLIGAVGDNGLDGVGINWKVKIMNLKILGNNGEGSVKPLAGAIRYAMNNGADIINISAVSSYKEDLKELKQASEFAYRKGVLIVAAAGNNMSSLDEIPRFPICLDTYFDENKETILGVSAINQGHYLANFSNVGSCVDITAPGVSVSSTIRFSPTNGFLKRYDGGLNGTSFATPLVSGAAALIKSVQPNWGVAEIFQAITSTAHHTPSKNEAAYANYYGAGLLQIDKAVEYAIQNLKSIRPMKNLGMVLSTKKNNKTVYLEKIFNLNGDLISETPTSSKKLFVKYINNVNLDLDHDGKDEKVEVDKKKNNSLVVYDHDSKMLFDFLPYGKLAKNMRIELLAGDYNGDNIDELITIVPGDNLSIWSLSPLRRLAEWDVKSKVGESIRLLRY